MQNEKPQKHWASVPFTDYLNAVDNLLKEITGDTSNQNDLEAISAAQEAGDTPAQFVQYHLPAHLR